MEIISISERHNNYAKRRKREKSKDSTRLYLYYLDDFGNFKTRRISRLEAIKLRLQKAKKKNNKVRIIVCSECGYEQEDLNQEICINCNR